MSTIEKALAKKKDKALDNNTQDIANEQVEAEKKPVDKAAPKNLSTTNILNIDKSGLTTKGYLIDTGARKSIKDEFRQIKRKLLNNAFGVASKMLNHPNLVMISSAKPNEGKTFVAINLALSIALEQDKTVLLVDADVLRPSINRELGVEQTEGLIEFLLDPDKDVSEVIFNTNIDKLKIIPAGNPHHLSNELLASEKMAALANELANRYPDRVVIFDCPPLVGVTETLVLANLMGQALIVVEESKTSIANIKEATESLNEDLAVGLVLNKAIRSHKDLYGYYGYGYGEKE
ncbi:XrtA-associated tyrosine autokinase [Thalassotalea sp. 1_MG-2023]|uniref:XrtA-associated tyrosine autokinase n=1 Tax=Thalassotalea sp. 1_MG-2023 TaxID=3062680 RepID=UPI0026E1AC83|nr:XrtA-associated tyrosine autokinase [Thalassotalea sp. 1_MG-2023]MDO6425478.1 XrtA-associated tyrosine autokinase [Thalassotalea sp. 1_MG-2023]